MAEIRCLSWRMVGLPQASGRSDLMSDEIIRLDLSYIDNCNIVLFSQ